MNAVGGYFELELPFTKGYHPDAIALNSGRFCLEYVLRCRKYKCIYVPLYTCDTAIEPVIRLGIPYKFYRIDRDFRLAEEIILQKDEALLYTNYWGLKDAYCNELALKYGKQLILDYTQAFFSRPIDGIDTFYSCRKYFGVPDGGYLYTDAVADFPIEQDISWQRMSSLLKRIDLSPEEGYSDFCKISGDFHYMPIRFMSKLTARIMCSIDYESVADRRRKNYKQLYDALGGMQLPENAVPMVFPFRSEDGVPLRRKLIDRKIYVAKYWPNVLEWADSECDETEICNNLIPLPIDQRYGEEDMVRIIDSVCSNE